MTTRRIIGGYIILHNFFGAKMWRSVLFSDMIEADGDAERMICISQLRDEGHVKKYSEVLKNLSLVSQLGLSLIMPVLLCLFLCWLIVNKTGAGTWVYLIGFFFGLGGSVMTAYKVWHAVMKKNNDNSDDNDDRQERIGFNEHL